MERCNHTCKAQQQHVCEQQQSFGDILSCAHIRHMLDSPRVDASNFGASLRRTCMLDTASRFALNSKLCKFALPLLVQHRQFEHIAEASEQRKLAVELCNRTCKAQQPHVCEQQQSFGDILSCAHIRRMLDSPRVDV